MKTQKNKGKKWIFSTLKVGMFERNYISNKFQVTATPLVKVNLKNQKFSKFCEAKKELQ